jgi:hypothetical protein
MLGSALVFVWGGFFPLLMAFAAGIAGLLLGRCFGPCS